MTTAETLPGYDIPAVETWIGSNVPALVAPFKWLKLEGGHSNLTYALLDARGRKAVVRRPPLGELLPKAHDMGREWAVISALGRSSVPVPEALGFCDDVSITGAVFYVMGHIDGRPLYNADDTRRLVPGSNRKRLAYSFIDVLAELHQIDPVAMGLGDLGKRGSYIGRQLKTWYRSWSASIGPAKYDDPRAHALQKYFLEHLPEQGSARIVHGDYGLHNCLFGADGAVAAVVDWEISTLGDPLADLAYALNRWHEPNDRPLAPPGSATNVPGFPSRGEIAARYSARTGRDLSSLDYYCGFNHWKTAAINHGVYARYIEGKKSHEGVDLEDLRSTIDSSLTLAEQAVGRIEPRGPPASIFTLDFLEEPMQ